MGEKKQTPPTAPANSEWGDGLPRRILGAGLIAGSVVALTAPIAVGSWSLQFLSLLPLAIGLADLYATITNPRLRGHPTFYATGLLALGAALLLYLSASMIAAGVVLLLLVFLASDGVWKIGQTLFGADLGAPRLVGILNGASSLALASVGWLLWKNVGIDAALGVAIAGYTAAAGWRILVSRNLLAGESERRGAQNGHPDPKLDLGKHALFKALNKRLTETAPARWQSEIYWLAVIGLALFATHVGRMPTYDTWLGLVSPFVATGGDLVVAITLGGLLVLPLRLVWRWLSRPIERKAWRLRISGQDEQMEALPRRLLHAWSDARFAYSATMERARSSLPTAGGLALRLGLPLAIFFAAINPIWGFSWYFNTESWASGFYQKITELRVDVWRVSMASGVAAAYGGQSADFFEVTPEGVEGQDFSFLVIGDPGEGDASQFSLMDRYLKLGRRDDVKFLIISSDVIYPAGAMDDYENNFYLPFKGFTKPIYAIPGNHDWFDALEGFNANFLEPRAARAALAARAETDLQLTGTDEERIERLLGRAKQLRDYYGIRNARQKAPFFELQTEDFALIAIDTGIRRTVDEVQLAWIRAALARSNGKFIMALVGHPKYAAGIDSAAGDEEFSALYGLLEGAGADVLMAGDTHAFEYYVETASAEPANPVHHFVNGGGGAYLSIGGALAWPQDPPTEVWGYYPSYGALHAKLDAETPAWKQPFWMWIKRFGAWPISIETLSAMFDFNNAPFFQSFMEVRVERSRNRVVFALHGANGPVRWRDLQASADGQRGPPDAPVEFILKLAGDHN